MSFEFKFPDVGEGITEGVLVKWLVAEGDEVRADDPIAEVETDKAIVELPSPRSGKILSLKVKAGDQIVVGQVIVEIDSAEGDSPDTANEDSVGVVGDLSSEVTVIDEAPEVISEPTETSDVMATPAIRKLAKDKGVDLAKLTGTGSGGRITEEDVNKAGGDSSAPAAKPAGGMKKMRKYDMWGMIDHTPYQGIRKTIGDHMAKSAFTAPHVTHTDVLDATNLVKFRTEEKEKGNKLSYMAFIMKAVTRALKEHPTLNATLDDENADFVQKNYWSMSFAVDTEAGLMAPVVKRVNQKTAADITEEIGVLAVKARDRKLDPMDMKGSSFTISNVGSIGGLFFTPIINHPEVAILGMGRLHDAPLVKDGQVVAAPTIPLSLSYDHRVVDGAEGARFLKLVMELLQDPAALMNAEDAIH